MRALSQAVPRWQCSGSSIPCHPTSQSQYLLVHVKAWQRAPLYAQQPLLMDSTLSDLPSRRQQAGSGLSEKAKSKISSNTSRSPIEEYVYTTRSTLSCIIQKGRRVPRSRLCSAFHLVSLVFRNLQPTPVSPEEACFPRIQVT